MQHIIDAPQAGASDWLVRGAEGADCAIRVAETNDDLPQSCSVDRLLFILSGSAEATVGNETFPAPVHALVLLPAGTPHQIRPIGGTLRVLEVLAPVPARDAYRPAEPRSVPNAAALVRPLLAENFSQGGFAYQSLSDRKSGSANVRVNVVEVRPGAGSPDFHIHAFDQFYFILAGRMHVEIGRKLLVAEAGSLVRLPAGVIHRNYNLGPEPEKHVTLIVPEPGEGEIFDYACDIHEHEAEIMAAAPGWAAPQGA
jgi:mannose-6-phosphate isomerase-like protein (cupin superfamily)